MFKANVAVIECQEALAVLTKRWRSLTEKGAWDRFYNGTPKYRGVVSEQGFDLTMYPGRRGYPVICCGEFEPTEQGTRIRVQFFPAITLERMVFLTGSCVVLAVLATIIWIVWGHGITLKWEPVSVALGIGVLTFIGLVGAGVGIGCNMLIYWMEIRFARNNFCSHLVGVGAYKTAAE